MKTMGTAKADTLFGRAENDSIRGGRAADRLIGQDGDDAIRGGKGNDIIIGGAGNDTLHGGPGRDTFVFFLDGTDGFDTIRDFDPAKDHVALYGPGASTPLSISLFHSGAAAALSHDRIIYNPANGVLSLDLDGSGPLQQIGVAHFNGSPGMSADLFLV